MEKIDIFLLRLLVIAIVLSFIGYFIHPVISMIMGIICIVALFMDAIEKNFDK